MFNYVAVGFTEWHFKTANNNDHKKMCFNTRLQVVLIVERGLFSGVLNVQNLIQRKVAQIFS